ncbi:uncharacterized protein LOC120335997 [Styela clava]
MNVFDFIIFLFVVIVVQGQDPSDVCDISPCKNGATCQYSTAEPYYNCTCQTEYNGTICEDLKYKFDGNCKYHVNFYKKKTFGESNTTCNSLGGTVAMMKTDAIQDFVESQIIDQYGEGGGTISFWIGAYKPNTDWLWFDGTPITNGKWAWTAVSRGNGYLLMSSYTTTRDNMRWINNDGSRDQGYVCEVPTIDLCSPSPCLHWGTCSRIGCQRICKCLDGFTGDNCETTPISIFPTKQNYTTSIGEFMTVSLNIQSNHVPVRIRAFRNSNFNNVISIKRNVVSNVTEIQLGPFKDPSTKTIYTFRADPESNLGAYFISTSITVVIEAGATISQLQPTDIIIGTSPYSIRCYATGVPFPTIRWYKDSIPITKSSSTNVYQRMTTTYAEFNAQKANISDAGIYTCVATNTIQGIEKSANTTAVVRAKVTLVNSSVTMPNITSESLHLMCSFEGFPVPKIEWKFKRDVNYQKIFPNLLGSVFKYQNYAEPADGPNRSSSQLYISLSEFLGTIEVVCTTWNEFENSSDGKAFQMNQNVAISSGKLYKLFGKMQNEKRNMSGAEYFCYSTGSRLAKISNSETQALLKSMIIQTEFASNIYIGAKRTIEDNCEIWRWNDNTLFYNETKQERWIKNGSFADGNYVAWHQGRPDSDVFCLVLRSDFQWKWSDANCSTSIGFICERKIPDITKNFSATVDECSTNITLRWFTSAEAVGVLHRIDVIPEESNTTLQNWRTDVVPSNQNLMSLRLLNLNYSTTYLIRMTVCPTECEHRFVTSRKIRTKATIAAMLTIEANVTKVKQNKSCLISWKVDATKYEIIGFKIHARSVLVYTVIEPKEPYIQEINATTDSNHVEFAYSFNRKYSFSIQAVTCTGYGPMFDVLGSCVTERGAPDVVHVPAIVKSSKDGDVGVTIRFPEESNGPISCLFLILVYKPDNTSNQWIKTLDDLVKLAKTEVNENEAYIAFAMTRSDISDAQSRTISKNLGDETVSSCIVNANINAVRTKGEAATKIEIKGNNLKLEDGAEYSYFTISASPGNDNAVMLKFSNVSHFIKETATTEESTNTTIAITVTCIGILILAALLVFWIIRRKRNSNKEIKSATQQRSGDAPAISPYETTFISSDASSSSKQIQPESPYTYENDATCYEEPMSTIKKDENSRKTYENINPYETCDIKSDSDETKYEEVKPRR